MSSYYFLKQGPSLQRIALAGNDPITITQVLNVPIDPNCKVNVSLDLDDSRAALAPSVFCHEQTTGDVFYYFDDRGTYRKQVLGNIPVTWQLQVCRMYRRDSTGEFFHSQIFGHNRNTDPKDPHYQKVRLWNVKGDFMKPIELGKVGAEWDLMLGDFNNDGTLDILGRKTTTTSQGNEGDLHVWFTEDGGTRIRDGGHHAGNIGLAWNLQVADMNSDGNDDIFGYNANGDLWVWHNITDPDGVGTGRFSLGQSYGTLGPDWKNLQVTILRDSASAFDILGLAPSNGEVHGWFTNRTAIFKSQSLETGRSGWTPVAGLPLTRVA